MSLWVTAWLALCLQQAVKTLCVSFMLEVMLGWVFGRGGKPKLVLWSTPARGGVEVSAWCDKGLTCKTAQFNDLLVWPQFMLNSYELPCNFDNAKMIDQIRTNLSTLQSYDQGLVKAGGGEVNRSARWLCNEGLVASEQLLAQRHHFISCKARGKQTNLTTSHRQVNRTKKPKKPCWN